MAELGRSGWFIGDLDDPWVAGLAQSLPGCVHRLSCAGDLPAEWLTFPFADDVLVVHRAILTGHDREWLRRFREASTPPRRVVLCLGPYPRHAELERWLPLVDAVVPEATATDVLARYVSHRTAERVGLPRRQPLVSVLSSLFELRQTLAQSIAVAGYPIRPVADASSVLGPSLVVWDVPVLDSKWPSLLDRLIEGGPVIALFGFADRELVSSARAHGASACLELPISPGDLTYVLDRLVSTLPAPSIWRDTGTRIVPPAHTARRASLIHGGRTGGIPLPPPDGDWFRDGRERHG